VNNEHIDHAAGRLLEKVREKFGRMGHEDETAREKLAQVQALRQHVQDLFGVEWHQCKLLDVGCGQLLGNAHILGVDNEVVGIDMALPFKFPYIGDFAKSMRQCGSQRAIQTAVRQMLGVDRRFRNALMRHLAINAMPEIKTYLMDAQDLQFDECSFDGLYSFSVFQYVHEVDLAARQFYRVLKPGGVAYVQLHLYTSLGGSDHPLLWTEHSQYPSWGHLRKSTPYYRKHGLPVNGCRLAQYKATFERIFEDVRYVIYEAEQQHARSLLTPTLRAELSKYSEDELLTSTLTIIARKVK
jgi:ubiquinone/menaquinone biosynthesis C-methylase UbiE